MVLQYSTVRRFTHTKCKLSVNISNIFYLANCDFTASVLLATIFEARTQYKNTTGNFHLVKAKNLSPIRILHLKGPELKMDSGLNF